MCSMKSITILYVGRGIPGIMISWLAAHMPKAILGLMHLRMRTGTRSMVHIYALPIFYVYACKHQYICIMQKCQDVFVV